MKLRKVRMKAFHCSEQIATQLMFHLNHDKGFPLTISLVKMSVSHSLHLLVKGIFFGGTTFSISQVQFCYT